MRFAVLCSIAFLCLAACSCRPHAGYVATHPHSFRSETLREKKVVLVLDEELKNFRVTRPVYDWITGHPYDLSFDLGSALSLEISRMCDQLFLTVEEVSSLTSIHEDSAESVVAVILPRIVRAEVFFPSVSLGGSVRAEVTALYSFYGATGNLKHEEEVTGRSEQRFLIAGSGYRPVLKAALHDLVRKSNARFLKLTTPWQ